MFYKGQHANLAQGKVTLREKKELNLQHSTKEHTGDDTIGEFMSYSRKSGKYYKKDLFKKSKLIFIAYIVLLLLPHKSASSYLALKYKAYIHRLLHIIQLDTG